MAKAKTAKAVKAAKVPETVYISEADQYLFAQGTHYDIYKKLGAHQSVEDGKKGMSFAVWAPHAASVFVIGTFNSWNETANQMEKLGPGGIYKTFIPDVGLGELYKFLIITPDGRKLYKADPFANQGEVRPGTASVTTDITNFKWSDSKWIEERSAQDPEKAPVAIYECHIGSWMKHPDTEDGFYNYREFADRIVEYLKKLKYTHIELMGIAEHPFDGSWGYQVTGYYAPTSRYGTPEDFAYLVNKLHRNKIGVILDWVPAHFPKDAHGLADFDGEALFEYPDPRMGEHPEWGTKVFNYAKNEVKGFLITNALYWIKEFHVDGLRVDAVASMLYLDYGRKDGEWVRNRYGGNKNLDAIEFFKHFNSVIRGTYPGIMTIAEESTAWPNVTGKIGSDSLGFTFKWNMGWMHDFCEYMKLDPYFRKNDHHALGIKYSEDNLSHVLSDADYEIDNSWDGFEWINADDADRSTYSFIRKTSGEKTKRLLFVLNMTPVERKDYCVGVPEKKKYKLVLNSAEKRFGGSGEELKTDYTATAEPSDYKPYRITFDLPAYGALVFAF